MLCHVLSAKKPIESQTEIEIAAVRRVFSMIAKGSDVICVLKKSIEYSFVCFKCFMIHRLGNWNRNCTLSLF